MIRIKIPNPNGKVKLGDHLSIPVKAGLYALYSANDELLYIGKAKNIKTRISQHLNGNDTGTCEMSHNIEYAIYWTVPDPTDREIYETYMINTMQPPWNVDKVFSYKTSRYAIKWYKPELIEQERQEHEQMMAELAEKIWSLG